MITLLLPYVLLLSSAILSLVTGKALRRGVSPSTVDLPGTTPLRHVRLPHYRKLTMSKGMFSFIMFH